MEFARRGACLLLSGRDVERLENVSARCLQVGAGMAATLPFDMGQGEGLEQVAREGWRLLKGVDLLFCCAGVSQRGLALDTQMSVVRKVMEVDFFGQVALIRWVAGLMVGQGGGRIAVMSSIAGELGFPLRGGYSAAKHALEGYVESLEAECYANGIRTSIVVGGRINTPISLRALEGDGREHGVMDPGQAGGISAQRAAQRIARGLLRGRRKINVGGVEMAILWIRRFFPALSAAIVRRTSAV